LWEMQRDPSLKESYAQIDKDVIKEWGEKKWKKH
jgi:hypothetical protein